MATLRYSILMILGMVLPYLVQRWDRARLDPDQRAAAWNTATWGAALYAFGPLSMLGWVWVTRARYAAWWDAHGPETALLKSAALLGVGIAVAAGLFGALVGVDFLLTAVAGMPE